MKKLFSLLLALAMVLTCAAALAEAADPQTGVYTIYNETGEKVTELYLIDNITEEQGDNLALDPEDATIDGIEAGEVIVLEYSIPAGEEGSKRLTLSFKTEGGYEGKFDSLSIEVAPITLLAAADVATGATQISFTNVEQTGAYTIYNKTGETVTELYITVIETGDKGENLAGEGLAADASIDVTKTIDKAIPARHALILTFKTESGYEGHFDTLSIEEAPITLLAATDVETGATMIKFAQPED